MSAKPDSSVPRKWQFGLRQLLIALTIIAVICAYAGWQLHRQRVWTTLSEEFSLAMKESNFDGARRAVDRLRQEFPKSTNVTLMAIELEIMQGWHSDLPTKSNSGIDVAPESDLNPELLLTAFGGSTLNAQSPMVAASVPDGFELSLAASSPIVEHPIMAGFDDRGRLFVAENAGKNLKREDLERELPNSVVLLMDTDDDGIFDKRTVFADKLTFPQGALWHDGWLYVASSGAIWRFRDTNGDDVADVREQIVGKFGYTGNAADVHGCFLGPEGRIYWCEGRHGHEISNSAGELISKGKAARIFSCQPDGSDLQVHCGGGMDNPTEINWTATGEMLGTVNIMLPKRGDCLVHWLHGGVYPRQDQPTVLAEFKRTGELLGPVHDFGHVAVSGLCRYRPFTKLGEGFGQEWNESWFVTEFNTHQVKHIKLHREGSTFRAEVKDFFKSTNGDCHPTDVLQDADGSLLVIDTGGWFRIGCPTSQIAKPEIPGAIYRIRRSAAKPISDPRGLKIAWDRATAEELVEYLADPRPEVRARAIAQLVRNKDAAVPYLAKAIEDENPTRHLSAVETLTKIASLRAASVLRRALAAEDSAVQQLAALGLGASKDEAAVDALTVLLDENQKPEVQLAAATALGKIGDPTAVPAILAALSRALDRSREHAFIYALIEIDDPDSTRHALSHASPSVKRAGLIALDQMPSGDLRREEMAKLLSTSDESLQTTVLEILSRRPGWTDELITSVRQILSLPQPDDSQRELIASSLVAYASQPAVQQLVAERLADEKLAIETRLLLLESIGQARLEPLPLSWQSLVLSELQNSNDTLVKAAIGAIGKDVQPFAATLSGLSHDEKRSAELRLAAYSVVSAKSPISPTDFDWLTRQLQEANAPALRIAAARVLGGAKLTVEQQGALTKPLATAGPLEFPALLAAFENPGDEALGKLLGSALLRSPGTAVLSLSQLDGLLKHYPASTRVALQPLLARLDAATAQQSARLDEVRDQLPTGDANAGKSVFHSRQSGCFLCHRIGNDGGRVGPDLSTIGQRRNHRDLLEAILFPSSSLARGYESQTMMLGDGRALSGLIVRETSAVVTLRLADQSEVRIPRSSIEAMKPSPVSIMPAGLDQTLSRQQLADLLAYLQSLQ